MNKNEERGKTTNPLLVKAILLACHRAIVASCHFWVSKSLKI